MPEETKSPTPPPSGEQKAAAAPAKPAGPVPIPWDSPVVAKLKGQYGSGIREANTYLGQNYMIVDPSIASELLQILREREQFFCGKRRFL